MQNTTHYNQRLNINELNNTTNLEEAIKNAEHLYISNLLGDEELLSSINSYLKKYNKKLWLSLDESTEMNQENLKQLRYLTNVKKLKIIVFNGFIEDLSELSNINDLEEFTIYHNVKKGISLVPLAKFKNLSSLSLYTGLTIKQYAVLNTFEKLEHLSAREIDFSKLNNLPIKELRVNNKLIHSELIIEKFPDIEYISLQNCKDVSIENIALLPVVSDVRLRYMPHITRLTSFKNKENIFHLECVHLKNLENIEAIFELKQLKYLMITDLEKLKAEDFYRLKELPNLKVAYITFKNAKENDKFITFANAHNWIYKQPSLAKTTL